MKKFAVLLVILLSYSISPAMEGLLFYPIIANPIEPSMGTSFNYPGTSIFSISNGRDYLSNDKVQLDIGYSLDLAQFDISDTTKIRVGTEFFTYSRLRSEGNFKFPVETIDYFFGLNASGKTKLFGKEATARLRVAHISAHVVDGLADSTFLTYTPFVYSREFVDLVLAMDFLPPKEKKGKRFIRGYIGANWLFSVIPDNFGDVSFQIGGDARQKLAGDVDMVFGYDLKFFKIGENIDFMHTALIGLAWQVSEGAAIQLDYHEHYGKSIHGMFYTRNETYSGLGIHFLWY